MIRATLAIAMLLLAAPALAQAPDAARVLAIGGSVTEIVYALGQGDRLVGRDSTSGFPPQAQGLPDVGYMRALSPEGVLSVAPDLILAEDGAGPPETIDMLKQAGVPLRILSAAQDPDAARDRILAVADALGVPQAAPRVLARLDDDLSRLARATAGIARPRRVMFILSAQGGRILAGGQDTAADAMIRLAGAENAVQGFSGYKPLTDEAVAAANPDAVVMMNRGSADSGHDATDDGLLALPAMAGTNAARNGAVIRMDGSYLLGFGPRLGQAALDLHQAIQGGG